MKNYQGYISFSWEAKGDAADDAGDADSRLTAWLCKKAEEIGFYIDVHDSDSWEDNNENL